MGNHKILPWGSYEEVEGISIINSDNDEYITQCLTPNAELIINAVNNHYNLIEALEGLLEAENLPCTQANIRKHKKILKFAKSVLSQAKGESHD